MSEAVVKRVCTRRERKQFLELPWKLHRDDSNWVPPLRDNQKEMVGYKHHPFYDRNRIQTFLAFRGKEVCGRIAAILNQGHNELHNERRGFFGFFECIDDQPTADALFDAVREWFADQGIHQLRGPANPSQNHEVGLLVDGFDSPPTFMMTYNPEYYVRLVEAYGFRKAQDLYTFWGDLEMLPKIRDKLKPVCDQIIEHYGVHLRPLDTTRFLQDVRTFLEIYNRSLVHTWGFVPMSEEEIRYSARALKHLIVPELAAAAEIDGRVVGAAFALPDYNPRIKQIDGRLFPFGFIRLLGKKNELSRVRIISTNVIPEYQRMGVGLTLMQGLLPKGMEWGMQEAEFSWVLESNSLSLGALKKGGAKLTKTHRIYDWEPPGAAPVKTDSSSLAVRPRRAALKGKLEIRPVQNRDDLDRFVRVPWPIYARDPHWIGPLMVEVKEFLNPRKHPFYRHGEAAQFLALRDGVPLGRILASDDPQRKRTSGANAGCFGMFECADDPHTAHALLDAAAEWLTRRGRTEIHGPIDYSLNYSCGLLLDGFDTPPRVMMNHHRPYYAGLLESWGLRKARDLYAWWFQDRHHLLAKWRRRAEWLEQRSRVVIRPFRPNDFQAEVERCRAVYNEALPDLWGYTPMSEAEFHYHARRLTQITDPNLILLAEAQGRPVGFCVTMPDLNEAIRPLGGRLTKFGLPINLLRLNSRRRRIKTARMAVLKVLRGYRRQGIIERMILATLDFGKNTLGYTGAELSWTMEDNLAVNEVIEKAGARRYKTYRIYEKTL